jgi:hypothetical protein
LQIYFLAIAKRLQSYLHSDFKAIAKHTQGDCKSRSRRSQSEIDVDAIVIARQKLRNHNEITMRKQIDCKIIANTIAKRSQTRMQSVQT